jgi:hypothetical protein
MGGEMIQYYICPFCNRDVRVTAPPSKAEDMWDRLKRFVEAYKQLTLTMDKNPAHSTARYIFQEMERLEKAYSDKGEK